MLRFVEHPRKGFVWFYDAAEEERVRVYCAAVIAAKGERKGYRSVVKDTEKTNFPGLMGEYIAATHYGVEYEWEVVTGFGGDGGDDFVKHGVTYDAKTVEAKHRRLFVPTYEKHRLADVYVSCVLNRENRAVWVRGIVSASVVTKRKPIRLCDTGPLNWVVKNDELEEPPPPANSALVLTGREAVMMRAGV